LTTGSWFGGVRDARVLIPVVAFQCVSLAWLWLASRIRSKLSSAALAA